jgi:hypothetical protein
MEMFINHSSGNPATEDRSVNEHYLDFSGVLKHSGRTQQPMVIKLSETDDLGIKRHTGVLALLFRV